MPPSDGLRENHPNPPSGLTAAFVFDADLVRTLCQKILQENDPEKTSDLLSLLHAVIKDDQEEVRLRAYFLSRKYGTAFDDLRGAA